MKTFLFVIFLITACLSDLHANPSLQDRFRDVIKREEIERSGIVRLSEIFFLIDRVSYYTLEGYRFYSHQTGLAPLRDPKWKVLVDNTRFDIDLLEYRNLNFLPISLSDIDSIEVFISPSIQASEFGDQGIIHIHTRRLNDQYEVGAKIMGGNITGDPGPYKYTEFASENIDQIGPDFSIRLDFGMKGINTRISFKRHVHFSTFSEFRSRNPQIEWRYMQLNLEAYYLMMDLNFLPGHHRLFIGESATGEPLLFGSYGSDLVFINQAAIEVPSETKITHVNLSGEFQLSSKSRLLYRTKWSNNRLIKPEEYSQPHFEWGLNNYYANLEFEHEENPIRLLIGGALDVYRAQSAYRLTQNPYSAFRFYGSTDYRFSEKIESGLVIHFTHADKSNAIKGAISNTFRLDKGNLVSVNFSYYQKTPAEANGLWYWHSKGYSFFDERNIRYELMNDLKLSETTGLDLLWNYKPVNEFQFESQGFYRHFRNIEVEENNFGIDSNSVVQLTPTRVDFEGMLSGWGYGIKVIHKPSDKFDHRLFYQRRIFSASEGYVLLSEKFPEHNFSYTVNYLPVENLSLWSKLTFLSKSNWIEYVQVDEDSGGFYASRIGSRFIWDTAINKWLWYRQFRLTLILRNILNGQNKYHPLGASLDLSFLLQLEFTLGKR